MSDTQKELYKSAMNIINSLSFYSPLIMISSVFMFSMFTASLSKFSWFILWGFVITCLRWIIYKPGDTGKPPMCNTFIPFDYTYSTYFLTFTMMYFIFPMFVFNFDRVTSLPTYSILPKSVIGKLEGLKLPLMYFSLGKFSKLNIFNSYLPISPM